MLMSRTIFAYKNRKVYLNTDEKIRVTEENLEIVRRHTINPSDTR